MLYQVVTPPNIALNLFDILPNIVGSFSLFTFIVYVIVSSFGSSPSGTSPSCAIFRVIVIVFSPVCKLSAPFISIVAPSRLAFASMFKLFTQYCNSCKEYSVTSNLNSGLNGISISSLFSFSYFITNDCKESFALDLVTFII